MNGSQGLECNFLTGHSVGPGPGGAHRRQVLQLGDGRPHDHVGRPLRPQPPRGAHQGVRREEQDGDGGLGDLQQRVAQRQGRTQVVVVALEEGRYVM